jgi:hypothetical protein
MAKGSSGFVSNSSTTAMEAYSRKEESYKVAYEPRTRGQITRYEAGIIYKAVKNGDIITKPEFTGMMYDEAGYSIRFSMRRYSQDARFYDYVQYLVHALLNNDKKVAQKFVNEIQKDRIRRAGKKSRWYKYQTQEDRDYWENL